ncbi:MAG: YdcF family protein [Anaerolineae bacterium]
MLHINWENDHGARYLVLRVRRGGCLALAAVLCAALLALAIFAVHIDRFLNVGEPPVHADAIVVLASNPDRIRHAVDLHAQGYAPVVVFTDATYKDAGLACSSALLDVPAAQALGLPGDAVVIAAAEVTSTYEEAVAVRALVAEHNWASIIVVTDPFHTRRATRTFRALIPGVTVTASATPDADYDPQRWWRSEEGVMAVITEMGKLAFYWMAYGIAPWP